MEGESGKTGKYKSQYHLPFVKINTFYNECLAISFPLLFVDNNV